MSHDSRSGPIARASPSSRGRSGEGLIVAAFEIETPPEAGVRQGDVDLTPSPITVPADGWAPGTGLRFDHGPERLEIVAGTVLRPPPSEADRMQALEGGVTAAQSEERRLLESLGYID